MTEYIDKANLYKKISELEELARDRYLDTPSNSPAYPRYMAQLDERTRFKHMVVDFPSAEAAEVKHGKWETNSDIPDTLICSVCKCRFDMWKHDSHRYCPNCGARMDGE